MADKTLIIRFHQSSVNKKKKNVKVAIGQKSHWWVYVVTSKVVVFCRLLFKLKIVRSTNYNPWYFTIWSLLTQMLAYSVYSYGKLSNFHALSWSIDSGSCWQRIFSLCMCVCVFFVLFSSPARCVSLSFLSPFPFVFKTVHIVCVFACISLYDWKQWQLFFRLFRPIDSRIVNTYDVFRFIYFFFNAQAWTIFCVTSWHLSRLWTNSVGNVLNHSQHIEAHHQSLSIQTCGILEGNLCVCMCVRRKRLLYQYINEGYVATLKYYEIIWWENQRFSEMSVI